jgi:NodT family efflux transporter outer membrane factor (OMF) lipoprotein
MLLGAKTISVAPAAAAMLISTGCALHSPKPLVPATPEGFVNIAPAEVGRWPSSDWYHGFASPELDALIAQAVSGNWDLAAARARLAQADARARQAGAALLPSVDGGADGNFLAGHSTHGNAHETDWSALLSASYEVDFWGKNRATATAATYLGAAARADRDTVALTTLAAVANGYFAVLSLHERLEVARLNRTAAQGLLDAVAARFNAGLSNPVELASQKTVLANADSAILNLQQREAEARIGLALLVGQAPEGFDVVLTPLAALTEPPVGAGLPSELLTRRPDIYVAEANLRAADANLVAARAAMLPSLSLTAAGGVQNPAMQAAVITLSGAGPTLNLGAGLMQTLFDGGRLRALRAEAQAKDEELVAAYRGAILAALVDVENALSAIHQLEAMRESQDESLAQSERAFDGAQLRYRQGSGDFLALLEAQQILYAARDQYSQYRLARLQARVALCKALGGGWHTENTS